MSRYLGQHFLINRDAIKKIVAALDLKKNETVVEIGPGKGALTLPLAKECQNPNLKCQIIAVEKDKTLARELARKLPEAKIIQGDILKNLPTLVIDWKLVGNIPYYITGQLLRVIGELEKKPELTVLTIQKEVAERLIAKPPKMNLLAASIQIWAEPEIIGYLRPNDFSPPPEVESAIIKLTTGGKLPVAINKEQYFKFIKILFKQPRKTILNNLSTGLSKPKREVGEVLGKIGLSGNERPQNLPLETLIKLSTIV